MEEKKKEITKKTTKKKTITKKVDEPKQEVAQPQMTMEQIQQMMVNMMQMVNAMQQNQTTQTFTEVITEDVESKIENKIWTKSDLSSIEDEKVMVRSVVNNVGFISNKSGVQYAWKDKGDVETMTIKDILAMETKSKRYLRTPWLVVDDERIIEALKLRNLYKLIEQVNDVDNLIDMGVDEIKRVFEKLPNEYKKNFRDEIYTKVRTHELKDITIINALSEILNIDLNEAVK